MCIHSINYTEIYATLNKVPLVAHNESIIATNAPAVQITHIYIYLFQRIYIQLKTLNSRAVGFGLHKSISYKRMQHQSKAG